MTTPVDYSLMSIITDWSVAYTSTTKVVNWGLVLVDDSNSLMFVHSSDNVSAPTRTVHVRDDMSIELRVNGLLASHPKYEKVKCFDDVLQVLRETQIFNICMGSEGKGDCPYIYFKKNIRSSSERCKSCQIKYKLEYNRKRKRAILLQRKIERLAKLEYNSKFKTRYRKRWERKICLLRKKIEDIIPKCSSLTKDNLNELHKNIKGTSWTWYSITKTNNKMGISLE